MIASTDDLATAIKRLERRKLIMEEDLKDHMHVLLENLKPTNILKNTLEEVQESASLKHNLLKVAIGLGAGYFSRKMVIGKSIRCLPRTIRSSSRSSSRPLRWAPLRSHLSPANGSPVGTPRLIRRLPVQLISFGS